MKTIDIADVDHEAITDTYHTCKYIERLGIPLVGFTLGNAHDMIEEIVDNTWLPIVQVINPDNQIEGYIIKV